MNAPNETSPQRPCALHDAWIAKIFAVMSALYGSRFADMWSGTNQDEVREMWAQKLAGFASMPGAIKAALDQLEHRPQPPNLPEFLAMCRQEAQRIQSMTKRIEGPRLSADEQRERAEKMAAAAKKGPNHDYRAWMDNPRSPFAAEMARQAREEEARSL